MSAFSQSSKKSAASPFSGKAALQIPSSKKYKYDKLNRILSAGDTQKHLINNMPSKDLYDATGRKWLHHVEDKYTRRYAGGLTFEKADDSDEYVLEAANTGDGRIVFDAENVELYPKYHHKDHLGNVRVTFTDRNKDKLVEIIGDGNEVGQVMDFYPFGLQQEGEGVFGAMVGSSNRYGFNGKEQDTEGEWGDLTHYDYGFRIYNPAIAKFLSVDPLSPEYPWYTPYQFAGNMPISASDLDGREPDVENGQIIGYRVVANQGPTQIAKDINDPRTMKKYGYCLIKPITWTQIVNENLSKFPTIAEGGKFPGYLSNRDNKNDPEYRRLNVNAKERLTVTGDCSDCGKEPSGNSPEPSLDPSSPFAPHVNPNTPQIGPGPSLKRPVKNNDVIRQIGITGSAAFTGGFMFSTGIAWDAQGNVGFYRTSGTQSGFDLSFGIEYQRSNPLTIFKSASLDNLGGKSVVNNYGGFIFDYSKGTNSNSWNQNAWNPVANPDYQTQGWGLSIGSPIGVTRSVENTSVRKF